MHKQQHSTHDHVSSISFVFLKTYIPFLVKSTTGRLVAIFFSSCMFERLKLKKLVIALAQCQGLMAVRTDQV